MVDVEATLTTSKVGKTVNHAVIWTNHVDENIFQQIPKLFFSLIITIILIVK